MGIANIINSSNASSGGEIVRELVNSSDGQGLHFDGSGVVAFTPVDLGSAFSHEFVLSTSEDLTTGTSSYIIDYHGSSDRFIIGFNPSEDSGNLAIYDNTGWESFGVNPLKDLKVHHIVVTVDGTSAVLYDNGNQVATATISESHGIDSTTNAGLAGYYNNSNQFEGTIYRARVYNRTLSADDVRTAFERSDVPVADQYGSQTELIQNGTDWTGASGTTPPSYWTVGNVATFTIDPTSGSGDEPALQIEKNGANPSMYQTQTVEVGKQYRVTYRVKNNNATNVTVRIGSTANGSEYNSVEVISTSWNTVTRDVTATTTTLSVGVEVTTSTASQSGYIDSVSVVQTGVVQDLDLAFANPTQSLTVQDRSTNGVDGTASSSTAVKQVQRIVQLNATSARIGTSAGTPADRELLLDKFLTFTDNGGTITSDNAEGELTIAGGNATNNGGNISLRGGSHGTPNTIRMRVGGTTAITIASTGNVGINCDNPTVGQLQIDQSSGSTLALTRTAGATTGTLGLVRFGNTDIDSNLANILVYQDNADDAAAIAFQTQTTGGNAATRLTIGSDGVCTFANGINLGDETLSEYNEGTFTPTLNFGGNTTGITYGSPRGGVFTRIGRLCYVQIAFALTSKGSATSNATISGLPFNAGELITGTTITNSLSFSLFTGRTDAVASVSGTSITLRNLNGDSLNDSNFTDTTSIRLAGCYALASS